MTIKKLLLQDKSKPMFPDILWSRPENKRYAGKLLIIGGNTSSFATVAQSYTSAVKARIGAVRIILPDKLAKIVSPILPEAEYSPSTPSGSFAQSGLAHWLELADWADGVLIPGDLGKNSETEILLESFVTKYTGLLTLAGDSVLESRASLKTMLHRQNTTIVCDIKLLQRIFTNAGLPTAITSDMGLVSMANALHEFTNKYPIAVLTNYENSWLVAHSGQVSVTKTEISLPDASSHGAVWWLQNPNKQFEALTTAMLTP